MELISKLYTSLIQTITFEIITFRIKQLNRISIPNWCTYHVCHKNKNKLFNYVTIVL
jgi:hypothetical protein